MNAQIVCAQHTESAPDVQFSSSDNQKFLAHKAILSSASPVFAEVFGGVQPVQGNLIENVNMAQPGRILEAGLRLCYTQYEQENLLNKTRDYVSDMIALYDFCNKFQMLLQRKLVVLEMTSLSFGQYYRTHATQLYTFACRENLQKLKAYTKDNALPENWATAGQIWTEMGGQGAADLLVPALNKCHELRLNAQQVLGYILDHHCPNSLGVGMSVTKCLRCDKAREFNEEARDCIDCGDSTWIATGNPYDEEDDDGQEEDEYW